MLKYTKSYKSTTFNYRDYSAARLLAFRSSAPTDNAASSAVFVARARRRPAESNGVTNVKNADRQLSRSPLPGSSRSMERPTSSECSHAPVTSAPTTTVSPCRTGRKKATSSLAARTMPAMPAYRDALMEHAIPPHASSCPPNAVPRAFVSFEKMLSVFSTYDSAKLKRGALPAELKQPSRWPPPPVSAALPRTRGGSEARRAAR